MFKWIRSLRGTSDKSEEVGGDDTGEDVYETEEELDREAGPGGEMPRIKTGGI
jgi:hypothetical protein